MDHAAPGVGGVPCIRAFHAASQPRARRAVGHNQEPVPDAPPPTDFGKLDILGQTPAPSTAVDTCLADGFALDSGLRITRGAGALLVGGEAFAWRPWDPAGRRLVNEKGQWEVEDQAFALLALSWPRPDLLILGLGPEIRPLSPRTRACIASLGMRVEVLDTRNAAAQFNLLATERGVEDVAAALIPIGWREGIGAI
ncbi:hypothetical protein P8C59_006675 [Phyllachora maydis]|uniref:NADH dehydrogenase [ubiquinone] 1 alpha subcomplex assembly factor 3 n=1 Tax=Phyllachora maydis TaxID=1825666 RepID=A0AAD9MES5_9PEZI|nr:hypothetical protein P8C59_006675 [Phyllachora maydis]